MTPSLHKKIELYFEAQLSRQEEQELLRELLRLEGKDPAIDETLAVMLASHLPARTAPRRKRPLIRVAVVAAAVVILLSTGILYRHMSPTDRSGMIAYVGGVRIENPQEIMKIIDIQLSDIGESSEFISQTVSDDLDDIRDALKGEGI
ncbi:MAG: hypothetical protein K2M16_02885 [Muribaculaceae bacterium]|nr:hypothetical protein [Muribaculaceae bacterium]